MSFILDKSKEGFDERLNVFTVPPVETAMQQIYVKEYRAIGQISKGSTIEFDVQNNSSDYIILKDIYLNLWLDILDDKDVKIKPTHKVTYTNLPSASVFRQVDVQIQQQVITSSVGPNYPYKAMLDTLLYTGKNDQLTWLSLGGYTKDTAGNLDDFRPNSTANGGLSTRYTKSRHGKATSYKTKLFVDILQQDRLLLNGLPINIKLYPALDKFALVYETPTGTNKDCPRYSVNISNALLYVP